MTSRTLNFDDTDPQVTLAPTGFYVQGADWWTGNPSPVVGGTITEVNLDTITVHADGVLVGPATVGSGSWTMTLPAGTIASIAGASIRVDAVDRAGNSASVSQRIRYDATPPLLDTPSWTVRDERSDVVTFSDAVVDPLFGGPSFDPRHMHASGGTVLGPATACDASAPTVYKYAYLLDQAAPFATEAGGPAPGGGNPLTWQASITDDGVGVDYSTVGYRIRDVGADTFPLDWTPLSGTGSFLSAFIARRRRGRAFLAGHQGRTVRDTVSWVRPSRPRGQDRSLLESSIDRRAHLPRGLSRRRQRPGRIREVRARFAAVGGHRLTVRSGVHDDEHARCWPSRRRRADAISRRQPD